MTVTIRIPSALRRLAGGVAEVEADGLTVRAALKSVRLVHPCLGEQLLDEHGTVRRFINIYANDEDIRFLNDLETPLTDGDELSIVPAVAGGHSRVLHIGNPSPRISADAESVAQPNPFLRPRIAAASPASPN